MVKIDDLVNLLIGQIWPLFVNKNTTTTSKFTQMFCLIMRNKPPDTDLHKKYAD